MLVGLTVDKVDLLASAMCYVPFLSRLVLSRPCLTNTLLWLVSAVTWGDSSTTSQAGVPLEWRHTIYGNGSIHFDNVTITIAIISVKY